MNFVSLLEGLEFVRRRWEYRREGNFRKTSKLERKTASDKCQWVKRGIEKSRVVENLEQAALGLPSVDPNTYILGGALFIEPPPMNDPNKRAVKKLRKTPTRK